MKKSLAEWYIKNKAKIWTVIVCIIVIVLINRLLVFIAKKNNDKQSNIIYNNSQTEQKPVYNSVSLESTQSATLGEDMNEYQAELLGTIDQFITYCNEQKVEEAYNLLSDECKEEVYPSIDSFRNNYYNKIFNGKKKNISVENWAGNIYKVTFENDALSTGVYTQEGTIQDYITVLALENNEFRLNINNYIGKEEINKVDNDSSNIAITVLKSDTYMDYQTYTFSITNNTNNTILLDDKFDTNNTYIQDENGNQYNAYIQELSEAQLTVTPGETKELTIKYYNRYGTTKKISKIVFNKVILNYNEVAVKETTSIKIGL